MQIYHRGQDGGVWFPQQLGCHFPPVVCPKHFFPGIDNCKVWTGTVAPAACCLAQNAEEDSGDVEPDFSTPELDVLKQPSPGHLNLILFFPGKTLWKRESMACLTERKK